MVERVKKDSIKEVILATSATTAEGQTTSTIISIDSLKDIKSKISQKSAQGITVLVVKSEFLDDGTLFSAFKNRGSCN